MCMFEYSGKKVRIWYITIFIILKQHDFMTSHLFSLKSQNSFSHTGGL